MRRRIPIGRGGVNRKLSVGLSRDGGWQRWCDIAFESSGVVVLCDVFRQVRRQDVV